MSDQLNAAAVALGIPAELVQRSAAARAAETGASVDEIIAAWAGGGDVPVATATATAPPESNETKTPETAPAAVETPSIETTPLVVAAASASAVTTRAPLPTEVTMGEAAHLPEVITVPTAGIRERTNFVIPKWLTAAMLIVPLIALFALGGASTGVCGEATELQTDVITGKIVNCDGSEFTGQEVGGGAPDYVAEGGEIYVAGCAGCHGASGQGSGAFPALTGVNSTFSSCDDHLRWVTVGAAGWGEPTYGDTNKTPANMPGFGSSLSDEQIASVVVFERVRFGGADVDTALADCGLAEEASGEGGGDGEGATTDTTEGGEDAARLVRTF
jgi:mono/diheme cytochrome c family protein